MIKRIANNRTKVLFRYITVCLCSLMSWWLPLVNCCAQEDIYWIELTDKHGTPYSIEQPETFLTQRALDRRQRQNIKIKEDDLPVSSLYCDSITNIGLNIIGRSKWINALMATVPAADTNLINRVKQLSFVKSTELTYKDITSRSASINNKFVSSDKSPITDQDYNRQITIHNGHFLHNKNLNGEGILIALMDGGYCFLDSITAFNAIKSENRLIARQDFLKGQKVSHSTESHGTMVLSVLTGYKEADFIGSAPNSSFILCRTENSTSEYPVEADNWILGMEFADSLGADIINTSLGYGYFDDTSYNFPFSQFDGHTLRVSRAANIAATKGMLLVASAGNEGNREWQKLLAPAEADSVLAVGSIHPNGSRSNFSSYGPTNGSMVKPNVVAIGSNTTILNNHGTIGTTNGTSFSSPVIAGLAACLWQAFPELKSWEVKSLIEESSHQYESPDTILGYGIPDFQKAYYAAQETLNVSNKIIPIHIYPIPATDKLFISTEQHLLEAKLYSTDGTIASIKLMQANSTTNTISIAHLPAGIYILRLRTRATVVAHKVIIK